MFGGVQLEVYVLVLEEVLEIFRAPFIQLIQFWLGYTGLYQSYIFLILMVSSLIYMSFKSLTGIYS